MERDFLDLETPGTKDHNDINGSSVASHRDNMKHEPKDSARPGVIETSNPNPIDVKSSAEREEHSTDDEDNHSEDAQKQLVLYDPAAVGSGEIELVPDPVDSQTRRNSFPNYASRILPSVGAFTVQCANCFKWRLIPTKEKYEEIREHILEQPFFCETAREWRAEVSCDDPPDLTQDGSRLWAIDKPNIAQPPPGWERLLRIRGEGGTRFADVTFVTMTVNRIAWIDQDGDTDLRLGMPGLSAAPCDKAPLFEPVSQSFKKKRTPSKRMSNADSGFVDHQTPDIPVESSPNDPALLIHGCVGSSWDLACAITQLRYEYRGPCAYDVEILWGPVSLVLKILCGPSEFELIQRCGDTEIDEGAKNPRKRTPERKNRVKSQFGGPRPVKKGGSLTNDVIADVLEAQNEMMQRMERVVATIPKHSMVETPASNQNAVKTLASPTTSTREDDGVKERMDAFTDGLLKVQREMNERMYQIPGAPPVIKDAGTRNTRYYRTQKA
ncbi:hypothetical protein RND71_008451 [Anisodus tanguticus]|uniref:CW-type domain-containing protein n=1 Tax=Anisodus tanguticus TaxID=243964 RepID=A0AAE1SPL2_9SOLA|nr:hypothetical protein RND71_008451 [Anisodus tanguticus]